MLAATEPVAAVKPDADLFGDPASTFVASVNTEKLGRAAFPAGYETYVAVAVNVSDVPVERYVCFTTTEVSTPIVPVDVALARVSVSPIGAALEGADARTPRPKAATATSAMRLKLVFVDICFLSIVDPRTIRGSA